MSNEMIDTATTDKVAEATPNDKEVTTTDTPTQPVAPSDTSETPTQSPAKTTDGFDPESKSYKEIQRAYTIATMEGKKTREELAELKTLWKSLSESFAKATEKPYDPDAWMEELRNGGPDVINRHIKQAIQRETEAFMSKLSESEKEISDLKYDRAYERRAKDSENYPDFVKLEPSMIKILSNPLSGIHKEGMTYDELFDAAYEAAKRSISEEDFKKKLEEAKEEGRKSVEASLKKEAAATVAGGGKVGAKPALDPEQMSLEDLKAHFRNLGMVRDY
jgi:hypothetical protein